jgi:GNAT superfamily N-acetyltransferase
MELERCTQEDFLRILTELDDFWQTDRARAVHHPIFVHEFGDTAWVIRDGRQIIAYLFAFWSQTEPVGYIHLIGVRRSHQRRGIARFLYEHFEKLARERGCIALKALTPPENTDSVEFHRRLGFSLLGQPDAEGLPLVEDYFAPGVPRVVFWKKLDPTASASD